ncbi:hypothetical protein [Paraburkholderia caribensis]|uniref:hypothetical protein n=1 Tax=Paraburkholderia caribensis TaxID=75105 RepID=UPI00078C99C9|nr:hypothetical protein [Paraburkholderia caribensis]AMV42285.1 hypothetical protein ATN79_06280 [Paraburkholderia caribensis]
MKAKLFIATDERRATLLDALLLARYMLTVQDRFALHTANDEWQVDLGPEIRKIEAVLEMVGVDVNQPLRIPIRSRLKAS